VEEWFAWAQSKVEGARVLERKTGPEWWDAGYGIGQAHRKWVKEGRTGWVKEVERRFGAYATARQLERIAEAIEREDTQGLNLTEIKQKCKIVSVKEEYAPTAFKDDWAADWEGGAPSPGAKQSEDEERWERAVQDAQARQTASTARPVPAAPPRTPARSNTRKTALPPPPQPADAVDWLANVEKLSGVEQALREVLEDFKAAPPTEKLMKEMVERQLEEAMAVGDELRKALGQ
jgi:hypothetical protein